MAIARDVSPASRVQPVQVGGLAGVVRFEDAGLHLVGHEEEDVGRRHANYSIWSHRYPKIPERKKASPARMMTPIFIRNHATLILM